MNIGIIGVGGVGGYFGGKICRQAPLSGAQVCFVARGRHLDAIRANGLQVYTSAEGNWICRPALATDGMADLPVLDVCLLCVKSYDLKNAVRALHPKIAESSLIIPLLNGIDIYDRIREDLETGSVLPACVYVNTQIESPGKVKQNGGDCKILIGKDPQKEEAIPDALFELFEASNIQYEWFEDVNPVIWKKYLFIAGFSLVAASFDKTMGQIMDSKRLSDYVLSVMGEIWEISKRMSVELPDTIVVECYQNGGKFDYAAKTSFQRDVEAAHRPDERDLLAGTILRLGRQFGVDTPAVRELWSILERKKPPSGLTL
ncbi:MAG: 2-dehydropantoate 2-reductase [Acidobacteria bacterium]|nr:2-dehydropantoate 2-reductase [Acidobacteriota bacterium]